MTSSNKEKNQNESNGGKNRRLRGLMAGLVPLLLFSMTACSLFGPVEYEEIYLLSDEKTSSDVAWEMYDDSDQMSEDDISDLSDGEYTIVYRDDGYVSSLVGRFYDQPVEDEDQVLEALVGIYDLLGIDEDTQYNYATHLTDKGSGYKYYTYQQLMGDQTIENCSLVVVTDKDHYVKAVSNSFAPAGSYSATSASIDAEDAEKLVESYYPGIYIYSDYTEEVSFSANNVLYKAYAVFTDNISENGSFDMPYLEHYISYDGEYLWATPTNELSGDEGSSTKNSKYFENMTAETYSTTITRADGTRIKVEVPVCYDQDEGLYYLMDSTRLIAATDYWEFAYDGGNLSFITSQNNADWDDNMVLAYYNYIVVWDFFDYIGIDSIDRNNMPLLLGMNYCDADGTPIDNAGYNGDYDGWAFFGVSDINTASQALDIVAHEFVHGYTSYAMQGNLYSNEQGAINESLSDIMGNLCEMYLQRTSDEEWLVGETGDYICRSMSNPIEYKQPEYVGDAYYVPSTNNPNAYYNDYGGVHSNSSFLNSLAYQLDQRGMDTGSQILLWLNVIEFLTPQSDFDDVYVALCQAAEVHAPDYVDDIGEIYENLGLSEDRDSSASNASLRDGYFSVTFTIDGFSDSSLSEVCLYDADGNYYASYSPNKNGEIHIQAEAGDYYFMYLDAENADGTQYSAYYYTQSGWSKRQAKSKILSFSSGDVFGPIEIDL